MFATKFKELMEITVKEYGLLEIATLFETSLYDNCLNFCTLVM